ncbi:MAG TPA: DUF3027 domain-containing protein [Naasia sp.]|jgi:hypothetical protein
MRDAAEHDTTAVEAARSALLETTEANTVGPLMGIEEPEDGVLEVRFATTLPGYPGWAWSVGVSTLDGAEAPSVLEVGLLPAEGALTAPEWVPWSDRLADYRAAQIAKGEEVADSDEDDEDDVEDEQLDGDDTDDVDDADDVDDLDEEDLLPGEDDLDGVDFEDDHEDDAAEAAGELDDDAAGEPGAGR